MKKVTFIEPKAAGLHVFSKYKLPRLGCVALGTILKERGYDVKIYVEEIGKVDYKDAYESDIVCISTITSTAPRAYEIAKRFTSRGIPVVMGGAHPTALPDEALDYADYVVRGEGEEAIVELFEALDKGDDVRRIEGLSFKENGEKIHNRSRSKRTDLNCLPVLDFSLISGLKKQGIYPIETSRGCPYNCTFCSVPLIFGKGYRFRDEEKIIEEIRDVRSKLIFFYDDNFAADRERAKRLLRRKIQEGIKTRWSAQVRVDVAKDEELLDLMKESNCFILYIGFESINPEALKKYNKRQSVEDIERCIRKIKARRIRIHGMFIFGEDSDTTETFRETVRFAKRMKIDTTQFMILTPIPATIVYEDLKAQERIFTFDWNLYDGHHVVFKPEKMSPFGLQYWMLKSFAKCYSPWEVVKRFLHFDFIGLVMKRRGNIILRKWQRYNREFKVMLKRANYLGFRKLKSKYITTE